MFEEQVPVAMGTDTFDAEVENFELDFPKSNDMSQGLRNSNFESLVGKIVLDLRENLNVTT